MQRWKKSFHPHTDGRFHTKEYLDDINPIIAILFNYSFYISGNCALGSFSLPTEAKAFMGTFGTVTIWALENTWTFSGPCLDPV